MRPPPPKLPRPLPAGALLSYYLVAWTNDTFFCTTDKEAGQAFEKAATVQTQNLNEPDDAANTLQEAFKVYRKSDPEDAARVLTSAINHYVLRGNLRRAATQQQYLAELYEVELGDMKKALEAYEKAAEWFEGDNAEAYEFPLDEPLEDFNELIIVLNLALQTSTS